LPIIEELITKHRLRIVAVAADNEAVNGALIRKLTTSLPFLVHVPCAAHTIQLVVKNILESAAFLTIVEQLHELLRFFDAKEHRNALKQLQDVRHVQPLCLKKPNDTRWSSTFMAAERVLEMKREIECCFELPSIPNKQEFFAQLEQLKSFLVPFRDATDVIQQDSATLFDVYQQFAVLWEHTRNKDARWAAASMLQRWNQHVNKTATSACALLSFTSLPTSLPKQEALDFIVQFGVSYLKHYEPKLAENLEGMLLLQLSDFIGRTGVFASLESKWQMIRATKQRGVDPRAVWRLFLSVELSHVAIALLSIPASEASVERTFSLQAAVHSKQRNRMHDSTVEAEMFLRFNHASMERAMTPADPDFCTEMDDEFDGSSHAEAFTLWEEAETMTIDEFDNQGTEEEEEQKQQPASAAAAATAAAGAAAAGGAPPRRTDSGVIRGNQEFIEWWIEKERVTPAFSFTREVRNRLENDAWNRNRGGLSTKELEKQIRNEAQRRALGETQRH